jgi:membrane-associated phospholipid phosphatase
MQDASPAPPPTARPAAPAGSLGPLIVVAAASALIAVGLGIAVAGGRFPTGPDRWVKTVVSGWWPSPGDTAYAIDFLGDPRVVGVLAVVLALCCLVSGRRRTAVVALTAPVVSGLVTTAAKPVVQRTIHGDNLSYPSGHTAAVATLAAVAALLLIDLVRAGRVSGTAVYLAVTIAAGTVMAVDQIAIDAHYPTDTVGGLCVAIAVVPVLAVAVDRGADGVGRWISRSRRRR